MKVSGLISRLKLLDPNAEVLLLASGDGYNSVFSVTQTKVAVRRPWSSDPSLGEYIAEETLPKGSRKKRLPVVVIL